jgi:hypothetical protein
MVFSFSQIPTISQSVDNTSTISLPGLQIAVLCSRFVSTLPLSPHLHPWCQGFLYRAVTIRVTQLVLRVLFWFPWFHDVIAVLSLVPSVGLLPELLPLALSLPSNSLYTVTCHGFHEFKPTSSYQCIHVMLMEWNLMCHQYWLP